MSTAPIHLSHNVSLLMYHFVCPAKYRRVVFDGTVEAELKDICEQIELRYDIRFLEVGTDKDHVHFLIQSLPKFAPTQIIKTVKSITAKEIFARCPQVKKKLWGGEFWTDGYYVATVGRAEDTIRKYVQNQGKEKEYEQLLVQQPELF